MSSRQPHPRYAVDRKLVTELLSEDATDYNLVEVGRLLICYQDSPLSLDIQRDLGAILRRWGYNRESLFERTRQIHSTGKIYRGVRGRINYRRDKGEDRIYS